MIHMRLQYPSSFFLLAGNNNTCQGVNITEAENNSREQKRRKAMNTISHFDKFTERAGKVISLAHDEAQFFQHNYIGTEHLLLGLLREGEGTPARVLEALGVTLERLRKAVEVAKGRGDASAQANLAFTPHANMALEMAMKRAERQFLPRSTSSQTPLIGS